MRTRPWYAAAVVVVSLVACGEEDVAGPVTFRTTAPPSDASTTTEPVSTARTVPEWALEAALGCIDGSYMTLTATWADSSPGEPTRGEAVDSHLALHFSSFPAVPATLPVEEVSSGYFLEERFERVAYRSGGEGLAAFSIATPSAGGYYVIEAAFCDGAIGREFVA